MVIFASKGQVAEFVCAAGVLTHYLGDACQPLHISKLHDGDPDRPVSRTVHHQNGTVEHVQDPLGKGVHAAYEDEMVNANRDELVKKLKQTPKATAAERITNGFQAAKLTIKLMRDTFTRLPPASIVQRFLDFDGTKKERAADFWSAFGAKTIRCMQSGTHTLAVLWESAWAQGSGETKVTSTAKLDEDDAMKTCRNRDFLKSCSIESIGEVLKMP